MRITSKTAAPVLRSGGVVSLALAASAFVIFLNTDKLVERSLSNALATEGWSTIATKRPQQVPVAGSEDFWLSQSGSAAKFGAPLELVSGKAPIGIGETVKLTVAGKERTFEVAEVVSIPSNVTHLEVGTGTRLVLISLRDKDRPSAPFIRLVTETAAGPLTGYDPTSQRAL
jgi:hypothetical protein